MVVVLFLFFWLTAMWNPSCGYNNMAAHDAECFVLSRISFSMGTYKGSVKRHSNPIKSLAGETLVSLFLIKFSKKPLVWQTNNLSCVGKSCTFRHKSLAWIKIIPWKQMTRPWRFSSPALLLPTVRNDHKNLFFPRPCFFPGEFLRARKVLGPFPKLGTDVGSSLTSPWESLKN